VVIIVDQRELLCARSYIWRWFHVFSVTSYGEKQLVCLLDSKTFWRYCDEP
jgi:hypothetical protein